VNLLPLEGDLFAADLGPAPILLITISCAKTPHPSNVAMNSLPYHEPPLSTLLPLSAFLLCLQIVAYPFNLISSGLLGQILVGIIFGTPLASWLSLPTQQAIVQLGYIGLILLCYEGINHTARRVRLM
jgi:hypothetical protein